MYTSSHSFSANIICSLLGHKTCSITGLSSMASHFTDQPQHVLSSPDHLHIIPRLMTMVLVQCPGIYSAPCNRPSQFTLSFTAASRTTCCLIISNPHLLKFASSNPLLSIQAIIWAKTFPGKILSVVELHRGWIWPTTSWTKYMPVHGRNVYNQQYYRTFKSRSL